MQGNTRRIINRDHLIHNCRTVRNHLDEYAALFAVVKQDAYGHGLKQVIPVLEAEVAMFVVATAEEGCEVRELAPNSEILVLSPFNEQLGDLYHSNNLIAAITDMGAIDELPSGIRFHLQFDTGMNRFGMDPTDVDMIVDRLGNRLEHCEGIFSHLANAEVPDHPINEQQRSIFEALQSRFPKHISRHFANSWATLSSSKYHFDAVRCGLALYGYGPDPHLKPVMEIQAPVLESYTIRKGEMVSYGSTWRAPADGHYAVVAAGYGDGLPRALSSKWSFTDGELCYPIAGAITMDFTMVFTASRKLQRGVMLNVLGNAETAAEVYQGIPYEILCSLGKNAADVN